MAQANMAQNRTDINWRTLYRVGGAAAVFAAASIPFQIGVFVTNPEPTTAVGWFALFQRSSLLGLLSFELVFVVNAALGITTTLALYAALRRVDESLMAIALAFGLLSAATIIVARPAIDMLYLSEHYAAATEAERALFVAAGEALLSMRHGTAFHVSYILTGINLLIIPAVMLRSRHFNKATAYAGILAGVVSFGFYVPRIGMYISILSVVLMAIWYVLVARRLFQLGQRGADA